MNLIEKPLPRPCYIWSDPPPEKTQIVLHFTAGSTAQSAHDEFSRRSDGVSVPYIVDLDGSIWETYDDTEYWSYHLAPQTKWLKGAMDKKTIGIEIANWGPLRASPSGLFLWPDNWKKFYCQITEKTKYLKNSFRGENYFATLDPRQVQPICDLIEMLCQRHEITRQIPDVDYIEKFDPETFKNWSGVASHVNYRQDKTDFSYQHAFPIWDELGRRGFR